MHWNSLDPALELLTNVLPALQALGKIWQFN
jgi:hypothetical protein